MLLDRHSTPSLVSVCCSTRLIWQKHKLTSIFVFFHIFYQTNIITNVFFQWLDVWFIGWQKLLADAVGKGDHISIHTLFIFHVHMCVRIVSLISLIYGWSCENRVCTDSLWLAVILRNSRYRLRDDDGSSCHQTTTTTTIVRVNGYMCEPPAHHAYLHIRTKVTMTTNNMVCIVSFGRPAQRSIPLFCCQIAQIKFLVFVHESMFVAINVLCHICCLQTPHALCAVVVGVVMFTCPASYSVNLRSCQVINYVNFAIL